MAYLRRFIGLCVVLSVLLLLCSACSSTSTPAGITDNVENETGDSVDYGAIAISAIEADLKSRLKNPESLQIHSATVLDNSYESDSLYFCTVVVDFSAQNGFGGNDREVFESYMAISKADKTVTALDEATYLCQKANAQFGSSLYDLGGGIPLQLICSQDSYRDLLPDIIAYNADYSTSTYSDGAKSIKYIAYLGDLEGTATFYFYPDSEKIWQISYFWSYEQSFYDGETFHTIGTEYIATLNDVEMLREEISDILQISHGEIEESTETYFHDYECRWNLGEGIYAKLTWSVNDENQSIGHIRLILYNEVNGEAG